MAKGAQGSRFDSLIERIGPGFLARLFLLVILLSIIGIIAYCRSVSHSRLMENHAQTTAYFDPKYTEVTRGASKTYRITYWFDVNGKRYRGEAKSQVNPKYPRGLVFYNPDKPEENELQPIPKEEDYPFDDRQE